MPGSRGTAENEAGLPSGNLHYSRCVALDLPRSRSQGPGDISAEWREQAGRRLQARVQVRHLCRRESRKDGLSGNLSDHGAQAAEQAKQGFPIEEACVGHWRSSLEKHGLCAT